MKLLSCWWFQKLAQQFKYRNKQDQVHNANSAFILIMCLISQGCQSVLIGQSGQVGPGGPGGQGGQP